MNETAIEIFQIMAFAAVIGAGAYFFLKLPIGVQKRKIKEWLLLAVIEAEKDLGSGTGQIKLRKVYTRFIKKFRFASAFVSFNTFSKWVDKALDKMRVLLQSNTTLRKFVYSKEDEKKEG